MDEKYLVVQIKTQTLQVFQKGSLTKTYSVSTARLGAGEEKGSFKTPRGLHQIRAKVGDNAPPYAVFYQRRLTGEIYSPELRQTYPDRDWILTRILWLSGLEKGKNRMGNCDTMSRYIYIHGTADETSIGAPYSKGCIRMRNHDIIELYDIIQPGTKVMIYE